MTSDSEGGFSIRRIYLLTAIVAGAGAITYLSLEGVRSAIAFLLGAAASCGNLWLFDWMTRRIAPGGGNGKPWQAGAYITRYLILLGIGYAIVRILNVNPLAVVLGLLATAAALLTSVLLELIGYALHRGISH